MSIHFLFSSGAVTRISQPVALWFEINSELPDCRMLGVNIDAGRTSALTAAAAAAAVWREMSGFTEQGWNFIILGAQRPLSEIG